MDAGLTDETAVAQMTATYYEVQNSVIDLEEQINQVENSLSLLLAETPQHYERGKLSEQEFTSHTRRHIIPSYSLKTKNLQRLLA